MVESMSRRKKEQLDRTDGRTDGNCRNSIERLIEESKIRGTVEGHPRTMKLVWSEGPHVSYSLPRLATPLSIISHEKGSTRTAKMEGEQVSD